MCCGIVEIATSGGVIVTNVNGPFIAPSFHEQRRRVGPRRRRSRYSSAGRRGSEGVLRRRRASKLDQDVYAALRHPAGYRLGSDRGSPNHGSTLVSKRVTEQILSPARVRTRRPVPWRTPEGARRYAPNAG